MHSIGQTITTIEQRDSESYIVADDEGSRELIVHSSVFHCHKGCVDDNAQRNEQVDKGIHDEQLNNVSKSVPARTALPAKQQVHTLGLNVFLQHSFLAEYPCN